jgi:outer membrane protein
VLAAIPAKADAYAAALESRPEIKSSQLAVDQSRLATKTARAAYYPSVSMTGGLGDSHVSGGQNNFFNQMKTNFNANLGVSVAIPIYDNRQTKSAVEKAQVQEVTSSLDLIDAQDNLYTTMENYWLQATNNRAKYIAAKDNVASMQASYDLLQEQFRLGLKNIADLLSSRKNLLTAEQSLLQDKYTAVLNRTLLDFYSNGTISL